MSVTPETAVLTKFSYGEKPQIKVRFYSNDEWSEFWQSAKKAGGIFMQEYKERGGENSKDTWVGHDEIVEPLNAESVQKYTSSKSSSHYFVKEVEIAFPEFPYEKNIIFVDTPGLDDAVEYRSNVTKNYIARANAVVLCVSSEKLTGVEVSTIFRIFDNTRGNPSKVYITGTKYENLNEPKDDWEAQKQEWSKYVSGNAERDVTRFTKAQAQSNIFPTSGYISFLCDKFENNEMNEKEEKQLKKLCYKLFESDDYKKYIARLREFANVEMVHTKIKEDILSKAKESIVRDAKGRFDSLHKEIIEYFKESKRGLEENYKASKEGIDAINARIKKEEAKLAEAQKAQDELKQLLDDFKSQANEALDSINKAIDKAIKSIKE